MHLFYVPDVQQTTELSKEEALHCARVLRLRQGTEVGLTDGKGNLYRAVIQNIDARHCSVEVLEKEAMPPLWEGSIHIAVAPTKSMDRMEWMAEKLTEVGIDELTLLRCMHSERKYAKIDRLEKIIVSAMKQSLKSRLPKLHDLTDFADFVGQPFNGRRFIAHCHQQQERVELSDVVNQGQDVRIIIGPEGDFSSDEIKLAIGNGYQPVALGPSRLRTETAAIAACFAFHLNRHTQI